jgi:glucose dehydrogenase
MNRFTQKVLSGGIAAGLSVAVAASASAQAARSGAWTMNAKEGEWTMTGRDYSLQRFSPLKQITTSNVAELRPVWSFSTGTLRGHEGNPLVIGTTMYVNTSFPNIVYALDLSKPGAPQIWKYVPNQSPDAIPIACCDLVNRGTAYSPSGKIYIEALQGELIALDAKTGKELWKAKHPDHSNAGVEANGYKQGATMTMWHLRVCYSLLSHTSAGIEELSVPLWSGFAHVTRLGCWHNGFKFRRGRFSGRAASRGLRSAS